MKNYPLIFVLLMLTVFSFIGIRDSHRTKAHNADAIKIAEDWKAVAERWEKIAKGWEAEARKCQP